MLKIVRNAVFLRTKIVLTTAKTNQKFKVTTVLHLLNILLITVWKRLVHCIP